MPGVLPSALSCCCEDESVSVAVPGPAGSDGSDGAAGSDGANAYTTLSAQFTMPAVGETVELALTDGTFINIGQYLHIASGGYFLVTDKADAQNITVRNIGATGNANEGDPIPNGSQVSPGGVPGTTGSTGESGVNNIRLVTNRAALKLEEAQTEDLHPLLAFIVSPEPGVGRCYKSDWGSSETADDERVIDGKDSLFKWIEYPLA